jgi:hypothetical protein
MSSVSYRRFLVAAVVAAFLLIAVVAFAPLYWNQNSGGDSLLIQSAAGPEPEKGADGDTRASQRPQKGDQAKPPIGICRDSWIGKPNKPSYDCDTLFGPV